MFKLEDIIVSFRLIFHFTILFPTGLSCEKHCQGRKALRSPHKARYLIICCASFASAQLQRWHSCQNQFLLTSSPHLSLVHTLFHTCTHTDTHTYAHTLSPPVTRCGQEKPMTHFIIQISIKPTANTNCKYVCACVYKCVYVRRTFATTTENNSKTQRQRQRQWQLTLTRAAFGLGLRLRLRLRLRLCKC